MQNEIHLLLVAMISEANEHASLRRAYLTKSAAYLKFKRREKLTDLKIMILSHHFFKKNIDHSTVKFPRDFKFSGNIKSPRQLSMARQLMCLCQRRFNMIFPQTTTRLSVGEIMRHHLSKSRVDDICALSRLSPEHLRSVVFTSTWARMVRATPSQQRWLAVRRRECK